MKKIFTLACLASAAMAMNAQSAFNVAPDYYEFSEYQGSAVMLLGEGLSVEGNYVSGQDINSLCPFVWNTETDDLSILVVSDVITMPIDWDEEGNEIAWEIEEMTRSGSFRAINSNGLAVGSLVHQGTYVSYPVMYDAKTGKHTFLMREDSDAGGEGYGITEDGETIVGFYFDESWYTTPCIWYANGKIRSDLPLVSPGFPVDYASARWITPDGSRILGYAQDHYSGAWVCTVWNNMGDGTFESDSSMAEALYQPRPYTEVEGPDGWPVFVYDEITNPKPFTQLEPLCMSNSGEWVVCVVTDYVDEDNDQNPMMAGKNIRYNLTTGEYDAITVEDADAGAKIEIFGIADDGTAAGRWTGAMDFETWNQPIEGVIWPAGSSSFVTLKELFPEDPYVEGWTSSALSTISADGKTVMGYASDEMGGQTTFTVSLPELNGIHSVIAENDGKIAYDLQGRRTNGTQSGLFIINGKKVMK